MLCYKKKWLGPVEEALTPYMLSDCLSISLYRAISATSLLWDIIFLRAFRLSFFFVKFSMDTRFLNKLGK